VSKFHDAAYRKATKTVLAADMKIAAAKTLFTVTGAVEAIVFGRVKTTPTSLGALTLEVGIVGNTAAIIAQTALGHLVLNLPWVDASQANPHALPAALFIEAGADIILTTGTADAVLGEIELICLWKPISSNGKVAAA
jgi:hypothetical protein